MAEHNHECCEGSCKTHTEKEEMEINEEDEIDEMDEDEALNVEKKLTDDGGVVKKITRQGTGWEKPPKGADVTVHYVGTLLDGTKFDSSRDRDTPFTFRLGEGGVIRGWDIGVATMKKGEVAVLTCAPEYAYGAREQGKIPANSTLVFEVELLSWIDEKDVTPDKDGGVLKKVLREGEGYETPGEDTVVTVRYKAFIRDTGVVVEKDDSLRFVVGNDEVVRGFELAVESMKKGEHALATVKPQYGYGAAGSPEKSVPGNAELSYDIELLEMDKPKASYQMDAAELLEAAEKKRAEGNGFYAAKRVGVAARKYKKALEFLDSDYKFNDEQKAAAKKAKVPCHLNLAACRLYEKAYKDAAEECSKALALESGNVKGLVRRAKALAGIDEWDDAERDLRKALEIDPASADAKRELAIVRRKIVEYEKRERSKLAGMFQRLAKMEEQEEKDLQKLQAEEKKKEEEKKEEKKEEEMKEEKKEEDEKMKEDEKKEEKKEDEKMKEDDKAEAAADTKTVDNQ